MRVALVLVVLVGCAARPAVPPAREPRPSVADAVAWERGSGRPRDYRRAAAIYAQLCDDGRGEPEACYGWIVALRGARGVTADLGLANSLSRRLCTRGLVYGCVMFRATSVPAWRELRGTREQARVAALLDGADEACLAGDTGACLALFELERLSYFDNGYRIELTDAACRYGVLPVCLQRLIWALPRGTFLFAGAFEEALAELRRERPRSPVLEAYTRLDRACRAGDAIVCRDLPGREVPEAELCAAGAYGFCAGIAACSGPARRRVQHRELAEDHGVEVGCAAAWWPGSVKEASPDCAGVARRLGQDPRLREELEYVCREQRWSKAWVACIGEPRDAGCQAKRDAVVHAIDTVWPLLAGYPDPPACFAQAQLYARFAELLYWDQGDDVRRGDADRLVEYPPQCP